MLEVREVWKYYKKNKWVLKGINFSIREGEIVAMLGHNGAGKTTMLKCIMNFIFPQRGSIRILGLDNKNTEIKKYVSYLPDNPYLPPYYRVEEIIKIVCALRGLKWIQVQDRILNLMEYFELDEYKNKYIGELSKGTLQKVSLLVAILPSYKLHLWDEPSQNLDPVSRNKMCGLIKEMARLGNSFLISSHILTEIERIATRVMIIKQGEIVIDESIESILKKNKTLEEIYLEVHK